MSTPTAFWDDLVQDLQDPEFLRTYVVESIRISTIDAIVNALDEAREAAGMSKAMLARAIDSDPATMRRLFSGGATNPTLGTLSEVAAALGMKVTLEPLAEPEKSQVTEPLLSGQTVDAEGLAKHLEQLRRSSRRTKVAA